MSIWQTFLCYYSSIRRHPHGVWNDSDHTCHLSLDNTLSTRWFTIITQTCLCLAACKSARRPCVSPSRCRRQWRSSACSPPRCTSSSCGPSGTCVSPCSRPQLPAPPPPAPAAGAGVPAAAVAPPTSTPLITPPSGLTQVWRVSWDARRVRGQWVLQYNECCVRVQRVVQDDFYIRVGSGMCGIACMNYIEGGCG